MTRSTIKIVQITDCHLGENDGTELLSMNPDNSLHDVMALIADRQTDTDLLIATGDLANEAVQPAYQRLYNVLTASALAPFAWLPGNHDDPDLMTAFGEEVNAKVHVMGHWLIVLLNSRVDDCIYGNLSDAELLFLERTLEAHPDKHIMVCLHHHPVPIGSEWMDNYIVRNAHDFWAVIDRFSNVKMVVWGHVHQSFSECRDNIALLATPSTCIQFTPNKKDFHVENAMPGYRWFELYEDGTFSSEVERVPEKNYGTDVLSAGY